MTRITVNPVDETTFNVTVEARTTTEHRVTVSPSFREKLTGGKISSEDLMKRSFEFLLERESNTSILGTFDLTVISTYFPEFEETIRRQTT